MEFIFPWSQPDLSKWEERKIHPEAPKEIIRNPNHDVTEATLALEPEGLPIQGGPFEKVSRSILGYQIFGPKIGKTVTHTQKVEVGDTIGLNYKFLPGLRLFFASRVVEVFENEQTERGVRSGFVYQTLEKHPELGEEIFQVTKLPSGEVVLHIEAWSRPNLWFVKLFAPWGRRIQKYAARCAVEYLTHVAGQA